MAQLFNRKGWEFNNSINSDYGPVVKLHGMFGVRPVHPVLRCVSDCSHRPETSTFTIPSLYPALS